MSRDGSDRQSKLCEKRKRVLDDAYNSLPFRTIDNAVLHDKVWDEIWDGCQSQMTDIEAKIKKVWEGDA